MPDGPKFIHVHPEIVEKVSNHDVWVSAESESQKYITNLLFLTRPKPKGPGGTTLETRKVRHSVHSTVFLPTHKTSAVNIY